MVDVKPWKAFFLFAAVFNAAAGLMMVFAPALFGVLMQIESQEIQAATAWIHQFGILVLAFGLAYYWLSRDPIGNRNLALLGCIGKLAVFITGWIDYFAGHAPLYFALLVVADALFALVFYYFYRTTASFTSRNLA